MNELRLIRLAIALGEHRHFARTAEALNLTQPSLTRGIAELERSLGVQLFDRTRGGVIPTIFGRLLLERGEALLRSEATLRREIQLLAGVESGSLTMSAGPYPSEISVATAVARLINAHPRLAIDCRITDPDQAIQEVLTERAEVGIAQMSGAKPEARLVVEEMPPQRVYLACRPGHPLIAEGRPTFAQALEFPIAISVVRGAPAAAIHRRDAYVNVGDEAVPDFVSRVLVNSSVLGRLIARESDALCVGTSAQLADDVATGRLVRLEIDGPTLQTYYSVFYLRDRSLAPAARAFIDTLHTVEAEILRAERSAKQAREPGATRRLARRRT